MKILQPGAHLDHMLRQTRIHHVQLSSMADIKANMLLTLAAVVITIAGPHAMKPALRWPALVLIIFCLATVVLAIYAVMPKVRNRNIETADTGNPMFNLLFFGDFVQMPYAQFEGAMEKILNDPSELYQAQVREIYALGTFLSKKKYRFLRLAYMTFLIGLVASVVVFIAISAF
ncbi:MAG TPA: Pycsar system effector family protein [Methylomirabilota bacterium]|nr:Pycsar system effector family protein [Methylomirabilota bacterium]